MNRRTIFIAVPLLTVAVAIAVLQALRARQSVRPLEAAEPAVSRQGAEAGEPWGGLLPRPKQHSFRNPLGWSRRH